MKIDSLSVFFPAYNEEKNIASTIKKASDVLKNLKLLNYEIIVVNDGSTDRTGEIVTKLAKQDSHIRLITHSFNRGYGGALKTGFSEAKYEWVAFTDSDGQFDFSDITRFLAETDKADLVLGYRINRADSLLRRLTTFGWKTLAKILIGLDATDYSCGFKLIKKKVYAAILPLQGEEKVTQIEMLVKAKRKGFSSTEVGVPHYPRKFGTQTGANLKVVLKSIFDLFQLWWKLK